MRLPSDSALLVIDVQMAIDDPKWGPRNNPGAETAIAALLAVWREEGLPIFHIRHDSEEPRSPYRPESPRHPFKSEAAPLPGEPVMAKRTHSAFVDTDLEAALDAIGATTLVVWHPERDLPPRPQWAGRQRPAEQLRPFPQPLDPVAATGVGQ